MGRAGDQRSFREIEHAARENGMEARYLPVELELVSNENADDFAEAMRGISRPVLAYCRSGTRSPTLLPSPCAGWLFSLLI